MKKIKFICGILVVVLMIGFIVITVYMNKTSFSDNSIKWLIGHSLDILGEGWEEVNKDFVSLYTSNKEIIADCSLCFQQANNGDISSIICMYTKDGMVDILKKLGKYNLSDGIVDSVLTNYLDMYGSVTIAESQILHELWIPYCVPQKVPEDLPDEVAIFICYNDVTWIVSYKKNDQNIMTSSVAACRCIIDNTQIETILGKYNTLLKMKQFDNKTDFHFINEDIQEPAFLKEKEIPQSQDFWDYIVSDIGKKIIQKCRNADKLGLPEEILYYAGQWKNISADEFVLRKIYSGLTLSDDKKEGIPDYVYSEICLEKIMFPELINFYIGDEIGASYLAFSSSVGSSRVYLKPEDFTSSGLALVEYSDRQGMLIGVWEEGDYISVCGQPIEWEDISSVNQYMGNFFTEMLIPKSSLKVTISNT